MSGDHYPSQGLVRWWMRNHTSFPRDFAVIEAEYKKQQASRLADKFKEKPNNENDQ